MKRIKKVEESSALIGKVFDSFQTDSHQDAPSIYAVRSAVSNPNLLTNGDFQIWQRGEEFTNCVTGNYYPDRWRYYASGITYCKLKKVETGLEYISTKNEGGWAIIYQPLETELFNRIKGKIVTQSWLENNELRVKKIVIPEIWARDIINIPIARQEKTVITNVKLELGSIATQFVPRLYAEELTLCQRFGISILGRIDANHSSIGIGFGISNTSVAIFVDLPTSLCDARNIAVNYTGNFALTTDMVVSTQIAVTSLTLSNSNNSDKRILVIANASGMVTVGQLYLLRRNANSTANIFIDAEIY